MIAENIKKILSELPKGVELVAATKSRGIEEVVAAAKAGIKICGENYVQEAQVKQGALGNMVKWHLIGHLQTNKAKFAAKIFDCIETIDSMKLAKAVDKECAKIHRVMDVMIEVNSGREAQKDGCMPEDVPALAQGISELKNLKLVGIMTMGSADDCDKLRHEFQITKQLFEMLKSGKMNMKFLSMGMSFSYKMAIEEGANMVRLGTAIFGERIIKNI